MEPPPPGYRRDRWTCELGGDDEVFERAADVLRNWQMHRSAGLIVEADGPPAVGMNVAMAAPLPIGYVDVVCRVLDVIDVIDEPDRCGFTYGTLPMHPEQGEESFTITRGADGVVTFEIVAASRLRHVLARACPPVARRLQSRAIDRYLAAMQTGASA
jgi:uncharacterized protein (UPF0548 family)